MKINIARGVSRIWFALQAVFVVGCIAFAYLSWQDLKYEAAHAENEAISFGLFLSGHPMFSHLNPDFKELCEKLDSRHIYSRSECRDVLTRALSQVAKDRAMTEAEINTLQEDAKDARSKSLWDGAYKVAKETLTAIFVGILIFQIIAKTTEWIWAGFKTE